ncbi:MAG: hypothetical protein ACO20W_09260, partial [Anaerohalosphaeraceae bacterium]
MDDRKHIRISELLLLIYDGSAGPGDIAEMEAMIGNDPEALEYYVEASMMDLNYFYYLPPQTTLSKSESGVGIAPTDFTRGVHSEQPWTSLQDLADYEKIAPTIEIEKPEEDIEPEPIKMIKYERPARRINRFSLATALIGAAALLLMIAYVHLVPPTSPEVATVSKSMNAMWSSDLPIEPGTPLVSDLKPIQLTQGTVEFVTDKLVR